MKKYLFLFLSFVALTVQAQQPLSLSVEEFAEAPFDLSAKDEAYQRFDGNGARFAIVKVTSTDPKDDLKAYQFNFGNLRHEVELKDDVLWVYVQRNAKTVTISRPGYRSVARYDLGLTIEAGKNYVMTLSPQAKAVQKQYVLFNILPANAKAQIRTKREDDTAQEEVFGFIDENGAVAKSMEFGTYTYVITSEYYKRSEGRFTLNQRNVTHTEKVTLIPNFATVTLNVENGADIYIDAQKKGSSTWTGKLKKGRYQIECRLEGRRPTSQVLEVADEPIINLNLKAPTPILGTLMVLSSPLGANVRIDGKDCGKTPLSQDMTVGEHELTLSMPGMLHKTEKVRIEEDKTQELNITLEKEKTVEASASVNGKSVINASADTSDNLSFTVKGVEFKMIKVDGGTFSMGAIKGKADEKPVHQITLSDYYIGETEVTQQLWEAVMGNNPSYWKGAALPVEYVNWEDCQAFIKKLNVLTGKKFSLPTEAQWEYAARGGKKSKGYDYSGSNTLDNVGWYDGNSGNRTRPVICKSANELGIYDMSGNVWEWCQDWYASGYYVSSLQTNPMGPASGAYRVLRGGSGSNRATFCRVANRGCNTPSERYSNFGLRLALSLSMPGMVSKTGEEGQTQDQNITLNAHEYVDLGLPSGTLWATTNVGAASPADYGDYFAWGETKPKSIYNWPTYKWCRGSVDTQTKYCTDSDYGTVDNKPQLEAADDAATANWGSDWCMPTQTQQNELMNTSYTTWTWTMMTNSRGVSVNGYKIVSKFNGNSIFLPAAGYRKFALLGGVGSDGAYWSSSLCAYSFSAYFVRFYSYSFVRDYSDRAVGHSVRPVRAAAR